MSPVFTGIVRATGRVRAVQRGKRRATLVIEVRNGIRARRGESLAVNGVCLTVSRRTGRQLAFDAMWETLDRTNLGNLERGEVVNLEPSLTLRDPIGGHLVMGHVDGVATILRKDAVADSALLRARAPEEICSMLAVKGCVALDGVSLTLTAVRKNTFEVGLIPFTLANTNLGTKGPGDQLNVEVDLLARYVRAFARRPRPSGIVTEELLRRAGFRT